MVGEILVDCGDLLFKRADALLKLSNVEAYRANVGANDPKMLKDEVFDVGSHDVL